MSALFKLYISRFLFQNTSSKVRKCVKDFASITGWCFIFYYTLRTNSSVWELCKVWIIVVCFTRFITTCKFITLSISIESLLLKLVSVNGNSVTKHFSVIYVLFFFTKLRFLIPLVTLLKNSIRQHQWKTRNVNYSFCFWEISMKIESVGNTQFRPSLFVSRRKDVEK